jgi:hypothetical protein
MTEELAVDSLRVQLASKNVIHTTDNLALQVAPGSFAPRHRKHSALGICISVHEMLISTLC